MDAKLEQVHNFLLTCPVPLWQTPLETIETVESDLTDPMTADVLIPIGTNIVRRISNVIGEETLRKRTNYSIEITRQVNLNEFRVQMVTNLDYFQNWINKMNSLRKKTLDISDPDYDSWTKIPRFSHTNYEIMSATGGFRAAQIEESTRQVSVFVVSIHFDYDEIP